MRKIFTTLLLIPLILFVIACSDPTNDTQDSNDFISVDDGWHGLNFTIVTQGLDKFARLIRPNNLNVIVKDVIIPTYVNDVPLRYIDNNALENLKIESIDFSYAHYLEVVGISAFRNNHITELNLSHLTNLSLINSNAFRDNQITDVNFENLLNLEEIGNDAFNSNFLSTLTISNLPHLHSINDRAFANNNITALSLKNLSFMVFFIKNNVFMGNNDLRFVTLENIQSLTALDLNIFSTSLIEEFKLINLGNLFIDSITRNNTLTVRRVFIIGSTFLDEQQDPLFHIFNTEDLLGIDDLF